MSDKEKKKVNRRSATKYPSLKKNLNLKRRRYYIEPDYIDGVRDHEGNLVIRPLKEEELAWLDKFYSELIGASFPPGDAHLHTRDQEKQIYRDNNRRNRCLYNLKHATGELEQFNQEHYENLQEVSDTYIDHEYIIINEIEGLEEDEELSKTRKPRKKSPK